MGFLSITIYLSIIICSIVIYIYKRAFRVLIKAKIPHSPPSIPLGNGENPLTLKRSLTQLVAFHYNEFKAKKQKHCGLYIFTKPCYIPIHPELIRDILSKDFNYFMDRGIYYNEKDDPLSAHLFAINGQMWKPLRAKLTPTFTSGKMKTMFSTLVEVGDQLKEAVGALTYQKKPLDIKEILARFSTDVIGSCAFGIDCNSFLDEENDFRKYGKKVFQVTVRDSLRGFMCFTFPNLSRKLGLVFTKPDIEKFFMKIINDTVRYREENNVTRKDFIQILIDLKNENAENALTMKEVAAQAFVFFLAGFETSSTTMAYCLFELSQNEEMQEKVRKEIIDVMEKNGNRLTYDGIREMKYLERVIDETLRKYPPLGVLNRRCTKTYEVPDTDTVISVGTDVFIPAYALHHDPAYYPDPEKFDPDRFLEEEKSKRPNFTYIPFGDGPRNCIGLRFGLMQTKVGLCVILKNYKVTLNKQTPNPLQMDPYSFIFQTKHPIWLDSEKI